MNILNENEAIVINSLENWEKVAEILDKAGYDFADSPVSELVVSEFDISFYLRVHKGKSLGWGSLHFLKKEYSHYTSIQDTEFIAKHSEISIEFKETIVKANILKTDKIMKIKVLKDIGVLDINCEYTLRKDGKSDWGLLTYAVYDPENKAWITNLYATHVKKWLKNGYIEEVKEVSYRFEDMASPKIINYIVSKKDISLPATEKQCKQVDAFSRLTFVRREILKDAGYSEDWEPKYNENYFLIRELDGRVNVGDYSVLVRYGFCLTFPAPELAELALQHNQELFKTYLGV